MKKLFVAVSVTVFLAFVITDMDVVLRIAALLPAMAAAVLRLIE